ncbi:hypothetical protein GCM10009804_31680 [Kribbella hippodromi]|uniref:HTH araC/xylS-type domain-containing protein n=2 Tax=Kribbella hippodromi TaxID=434347 RepID=A0ABP4P5X2_9ACTN
MHKSPKILGAGIHTAAPGKDYPLHAHTSWELVYYVSGRITCPVGPKTYAATPGTVLLTPPSTWHAEQSRTGYTNRFLQVDAASNHPWPRLCYDDAGHTLGRVFDALVHESTHPSPDSDELSQLLLKELDVRLRHALAHIRNSTLPLQAIASLTGYNSASHLSRHIKAATGTAPGALRGATAESHKG